jgi:hypothetical protein
MATLPPFAVTPEPAIPYTGVGINAAGQLYVYGDRPGDAHQPIPATSGFPSALATRLLGASGGFGARPYLELFLDGREAAGNNVLRLPLCRRRSDGTLEATGSVRSLVGALRMLPSPPPFVHVVPRKGTKANFLNVHPVADDGTTAGPIRAPLAGADMASISGAIDATCGKLRCREASLLELLKSLPPSP